MVLLGIKKRYIWCNSNHLICSSFYYLKRNRMQIHIVAQFLCSLNNIQLLSVKIGISLPTVFSASLFRITKICLCMQQRQKIFENWSQLVLRSWLCSSGTRKWGMKTTPMNQGWAVCCSWCKIGGSPLGAVCFLEVIYLMWFSKRLITRLGLVSKQHVQTSTLTSTTVCILVILIDLIMCY